MKDKIEVEELKDLLGLVVKLSDCAYIISQNGEVSFKNISDVWAIIEKVGAAFSGIKYIPNELSDLSLDECDELIQYIIDETDASSTRAKVIIKKSLQVLRSCYEVYLDIIEVRDANP